MFDTGRFQLDGDASSGTQAVGPAATDDWDKVCHEVTITNDPDDTITDECASAGDTTGAVSVSWVAEPLSNSTIFTGGGSKDPINIDQWAWKDGAGGLPDKDNLVHSFAARYSLAADPVDDPTLPGDPDNPLANGTACPTSNGNTTCELLFFGSDRFDNSGDAQQGFWFFQNRIGLTDIKSGGGFEFSGLHENGDLLVISNFSNGGTTSTITVYAWDDTVSGNLRQLETSDAAKCSNALAAGTAFCGIVNPSDGTAVPWSFTDKGGNHTYLNGEFYEGGINLSLLPAGIASECFQSVASETRSSTSTTATLKDFVLGDFGDCTADLTTQVSDSSVNPQTPVHDTATVTGNRPSITPSGSVEFFMCSFPADSLEVCDDSAVTGHHGTSIGSGTLSGIGATATADSPDVNTAQAPLSPGRYCFRAEWPGDDNYVGALKEFSGDTECFVVVQHSTTTVTEPQLASDNSAITGAVSVGTHVVDHALVTGAAGFGSPTGAVDFFICTPSQVTGTGSAAHCAAGTGTGLSGNPVTVTAVADSDPPQTEATSSPDVVASSVGVWCFRAVYTPDTANYTGSDDSTNGECFTVKDSTSVSTAQDWLPNDSATVTSAGGTALSGTLTFVLHESADCTGAAVSGQTYNRTLTNATSLADRTKKTGNTTYFVTEDATVSWEVTFTSSDPLVTSPSSSSCEITSLDLTQ